MVPHGQLQKHWGDAAYFAAQGAVDGILDLLTKS